MPADALRIRGRHNATNTLAALSGGGCWLQQHRPMLHGLWTTAASRTVSNLSLRIFAMWSFF
jgi:hypothetical protein